MICCPKSQALKAFNKVRISQKSRKKLLSTKKPSQIFLEFVQISFYVCLECQEYSEFNSLPFQYLAKLFKSLEIRAKRLRNGNS